jgi:DNA-binding transcriptional ArsR family regulator
MTTDQPTCPYASGCDEALKALAHPVRRQVLAWLKDPELNFPGQEHPLSMGVCAGQFAVRAGVSQSTMSAHLALLQQVGLLSAKKIGQWVFFKRDEASITALLTRLQQDL